MTITFNKIQLFKHTYKFLNFIGHGDAMEGNRKILGCLQTFGGHCMLYTEKSH